MNLTAIKSLLIRSPFDLDKHEAYAAWRDWKLTHFPKSVDELVVEIKNWRSLTKSEHTAILDICRRANMAIYVTDGIDNNKDLVAGLGAQFNLVHLDKNLYSDDDGISALQVIPGGRRGEYIPYSNRPINWHTDGYYNRLDRKIRAMVLHCVLPSAVGGENALCDHEMVYILLREMNPKYIAALMQPDAMTIPANIENGTEVRPLQTGPVFSVDRVTGDLHMRYTARTRSIEWKQDEYTLEAVKNLETLLNSDSPYIFRHRLGAGQGLFCNNVLHSRTGFVNNPSMGQERLVYRARYYDRIEGAGVKDYFYY